LNNKAMLQTNLIQLHERPGTDKQYTCDGMKVI